MTTRVNTYECEGCGAVFNGTAEEAFDEGWDTPERFLSHCTCPTCPMTCTIWWKVVIDKQAPTEQEALLIQSYNKLHEEANS